MVFFSLHSLQNLERATHFNIFKRHGAVGALSAQRTINILNKNDNDNNNDSLPDDLLCAK
jgi:hypothetical protein